MDHFPFPEVCTPNIPRIPYLGTGPKYDMQGFDGFPERHGMKPSELPTSESLLQQGAEYIESFLQ
jgi:hypothetical protein